ncbi:phosphoglycerate mutase [Longimycelium tulufanense]|uniref:Phosphoglycerate mutase n=1 Tax=Longimycelium tulufanense TaxID=907463 RepID=A0A8J3FWR4_9PSEU|nr:histidine phosphatase family protein [Longimycelium tulufanense]GGM73822.1 phosphoglycerate mutase [Longimycelium tulufanense]
MATVILLRHARSTANGSGVLAGRSPGVGLDETGERQATALATRLAAVPLAEVVCSPLERCHQTVAPLAAAHSLEPVVEPGLAEVDYGQWTGRELCELLGEPLWKVVQLHPAAAVFPGGEGLAQMQARAVAAIRDHDARITEQHGAEALWMACSHGDVIKSVLADALGVHLDAFQRIVVDPCSVSVIRYTDTRPFVLRINDTGDLTGLVAKPAEGASSSDAVVGGSTGTS